MKRLVCLLTVVGVLCVVGCGSDTTSSQDQQDFQNAGLSKEQIEANKNQAAEDR